MTIAKRARTIFDLLDDEDDEDVVYESDIADDMGTSDKPVDEIVDSKVTPPEEAPQGAAVAHEPVQLDAMDTQETAQDGVIDGDGDHEGVAEPQQEQEPRSKQEHMKVEPETEQDSRKDDNQRGPSPRDASRRHDDRRRGADRRHGGQRTYPPCSVCKQTWHEGSRCPQRGRRCFTCQEFGHVSSACHKQRCSNCKELGHETSRCPKPMSRMLCTCCGKRDDHDEEACLQRFKVCFKCGRTGHVGHVHDR